MENQTTIILLSLILGIASGFIMHRSDFCLAGMFRDLFLFRSSPLMRSLVLLITANMFLFELAHFFGLLDYSLPSSLYGLPSLTNLLGGTLFGIGMVLAGGCVVGTLYKLGSGNVPACCSFAGLVIGSTLYAEFHPQWKQLANTLRLGEAATLPQLLGLPPIIVFLAVLIILSLFLYRWQQNGQLKRLNIVKGYLQPSTAAVMLAVISLFSFTLLGMPLGITTSYAKFGAYFEQLIIPEHVATLGYFQGRGFHYFSPLASQNLNAGAGPFWDGLSLVQFPLIGGIVLGSAGSTILLGRFKLRFNLPKAQLVSALIGGILMGLAARMTPACNVWHLMGGLPLLSLSSLLFTLGLFPGAWLGTRLLTHFVLPSQA